MDELVLLPRTFDRLRYMVPERFSLSERVVDPVIFLDREAGRLTARLAGRRVVRGTEVIMPAPSNGHAWVVDGTVLRPLPADVPAVLAGALGKSDAADLSYAAAIALIRQRSDDIHVVASDTVLHSGKIAAESLPAAIEVVGLNADLFPYQARGVQWMWETVNRTGGLILADEMGLGKTLQIIALLMKSPPPLESPALVICPTSLIANWVREIGKFAPSLSVQVHRGINRAGIYRDLQKTSVVLTTYDTMVNDIAIIASFEWSWVICDEAQAIKNPDSSRRKATVTIPRRRSIPMTGTPVENTLLDLWSLADSPSRVCLGTATHSNLNTPIRSRRGRPSAG